MRATFALAAGAALVLAAPSASADDTAANIAGVSVVGAYGATTIAGVVTGIGTSVELAGNRGGLRSWGIASTVTSALNLGFTGLFVAGAVTPPSCSGWICFDLRSEFAVLAAVNGTIGVANAFLAGFAFSRAGGASSDSGRTTAIFPSTLRDARGASAPGLVVVGRF